MTNKNNILKEGKSEEPEVIGWCSYCKDAIFETDDYVKNNGSIHHVECWKQENDIIEELKFD